MTENTELQAWRLLRCNWVAIAALAAVLFVSMALTGFTIAPLGTLKPLFFVVAYLGAAAYKLRYPGNDPRVTFILCATGQILLVPVLAAPLTYVAASANLPLQDVTLDAIDRALGFDWMAWFSFCADHRALLFATVLGYSMIGWPVFGIPIALGWTHRYRRMQEFTLAFLIALVMTAAISVFTPAIGTYAYFNFMPDPDVFTPGAFIHHLQDFPFIRDGSLRHLSLDSLAGIISFPSFHSAAAVLYLWALWPVRWMGPIAIVANVAMVLASPIGGGHYFIDIAAGIAVAVTAIMAAKWAAAWLTRPAAAAQAYNVQTGVPAR